MSHAHVRDLLFAAVALYFVSVFVLLLLNRDHDGDGPCDCLFCRREERA